MAMAKPSIMPPMENLCVAAAERIGRGGEQASWEKDGGWTEMGMRNRCGGIVRERAAPTKPGECTIEGGKKPKPES
jgi:hypothetical protein